jgi:TPR repeat protein
MDEGADEGDLVAAEGGDPDAMYNLAYLLRDDNPDEAETWALRAAQAGQIKAMHVLGALLLKKDDPAEAERWWRKAAEAGNGPSMQRLGALFAEQGDAEAAEDWYRRAAEAGETYAMNWLGYQANQAGDIDQAKSWFQRSSGAGDEYGTYNLGAMLDAEGDILGAEGPYRAAAEAGVTDAMSRLGDLLAKKGDTGEAKDWYRRAADVGDTDGMMGLGKLFGESGDLVAASEWYGKAFDSGRAYGPYHLGFLLLDQGHEAEAEAQFRLAAEGGLTAAMDNLGHLLQKRGELNEALGWYLRAADAGSSFATEALPALRERIKADGLLDSISFDTFGWERMPDASGQRYWQSADGGQLVERYFDFPPDHESWDVEGIRNEVIEMMGFVESPAFRREDLPDLVQKYLPTELPQQISLLEIELFNVGIAKCLQMVTRHRNHGEVHYAAGISVMFAECFWALSIELSEGSEVGAREGAVAQRVLDEGSTDLPEFDPYDAKWDGMIPIEDDPLTRLRMLSRQLRESITLGSNLADLDPFTPPDD